MYDTDKEIKVKEYINNYLGELQRHFDVPNTNMRKIVYKVYKDLSPVSRLKYLIKKYISMVKSFYISKLKRIK